MATMQIPKADFSIKYIQQKKSESTFFINAKKMNLRIQKCLNTPEILMTPIKIAINGLSLNKGSWKYSKC